VGKKLVVYVVIFVGGVQSRFGSAGHRSKLVLLLATIFISAQQRRWCVETSKSQAR
jgi:hypothetical protein